MIGMTALKELEKTLWRTADRDRYLKAIEKALTKLERIEAIDLDEVQICLNSLDTMAEYNYGYDEKIYFEIQNLIDTLRGVKDE